jgi:hypothetical protein
LVAAMTLLVIRELRGLGYRVELAAPSPTV